MKTSESLCFRILASEILLSHIGCYHIIYFKVFFRRNILIDPMYPAKADVTIITA